MKIINIKNSLPKTKQQLFGIEPETKKSLSTTLKTKMGDILRKRNWTIQQVGEIYFYLFALTKASQKETGLHAKHRKLANTKTKQILSSADTKTLRIYCAYTSLFSWFRLAQERIGFCELTAKTAHMILLNTVMTALRCEYMTPELKEETRKAYLYSMSLDQFILDKNEDALANIRNFRLSTKRIKESIGMILNYNKTLVIVNELISMPEILLLSADLTDIVGRVDRLFSYLSNLRNYIEENKISYVDDGEKKTKIGIITTLSQILDDNEELISLINSEKLPPIYKEAINHADMIKDTK